MPPESDVPLRDYLDIRIKSVEDKIDTLRDAVNLRSDIAEKALTIQAKEYERRLDLLNGEAERLREIQATYIPREVYQTEQRAMNSDMVSLKEFRANFQGRSAVIAIFVSTAIGVLMVAVQYFLR